MARAKYNVLVIQYIVQDKMIKYAVFNRSDMQIWQFIAGGGEDCLVIPEYTFAVNVMVDVMKLSNEHTDYEWMDYETAKQKLRYDSNKVALWEVDSKIKKGLLV